MSAPRFQALSVKRVSPEAAGAVAITFAIPESDRARFTFEPGQFLTLRATIDGQDVRRTYSISSPRSRLARDGEFEIDVRGAANIKSLYPEALLVFVDAPDRSVQEARLRGRGDDEERIRQRLAKAEEEVALAGELGVVHVVNDDLERALGELQQMIDAHRSR